MRTRIAWACALALAAPAAAADRELSTDRPDRTESAYTVPKGMWQVEMDVVAWTRDRSGGSELDAVSVATTNLKRGLHDRADLQLVIAPLAWERTRSGPGDEAGFESAGWGEVTTRLKLNLWGNDGGATALALMPFVTFPTETDWEDALAGGLIAPLALDLGGGWGGAIMGELDVVRGARPVWIASATASHAIAGELAGYAEIFSIHSTEPGAGWTGTFDVGLTFGMTPDVQLDGGANLGLDDESEEFTLFLGLSVRR